MLLNGRASVVLAERLFNECESNFGKGNVPIVTIIRAEPIQVGRGKSRELHLEDH